VISLEGTNWQRTFRAAPLHDELASGQRVRSLPAQPPCSNAGHVSRNRTPRRRVPIYSSSVDPPLLGRTAALG
jgi:hypothetical protein